MRYLSHLCYFAVALALMITASLPASAQLDEKVADRFWESTKLLEQLVSAPDGGIPEDLIERAECVGVIPGVKRAAFGIGGRYGRGLVVCRQDGGEGPWGAPSMLSLGGGSFGFQIGGQSTDVLMLFMTHSSMEHLLRDQVTLGADASVAAGPKGRGISAETSATFRAEILTYARSQGLFAGIALEGAVLKPDNDANESLYGKKVSAEELLLGNAMSIPAPAEIFIQTLSKVSTRSAVAPAPAP
jgi:lipid-binding SYLF domain-containing protein